MLPADRVWVWACKIDNYVDRGGSGYVYALVSGLVKLVGVVFLS